jgi:hypothetical protein
MSTIILGLQKLNLWTGVAFSLVAVVTVVNTLEPFPLLILLNLSLRGGPDAA